MTFLDADEPEATVAPAMLIDASGESRSWFESDWEGEKVVVEGIDQPSWELRPRDNPEAPEHLTLRVVKATNLKLPSLPQVEVELTDPDREVTIGGGHIENLIVSGGRVKVQSRSASACVTAADATVQMTNSPERIVVRGTVSLPALTSVTELELEPGSSLELPTRERNQPQSLTVGMLHSRGSATLRKGEIKVKQISGPLDFSLRSARLTFAPEGDDVEITEHVRIAGKGGLEFAGATVTSLHLDDGGSFNLKVSRSHLTVSGRAVVRPETDGASVIIADGLGIATAAKLKASELYEVSLYELRAGQVTHLDNLQALSTWWPRGWRQRLQLEENPGAQPAAKLGEIVRDLWSRIKSDPLEIEQRERRHQKWRRIATVLDDLGAPGSDQAEAHYSAFRWRLRAVRDRKGRGVERWLLRAYWLMGFGVRPARPLAIWAIGAAALAAPNVDCATAGPDPVFLADGWPIRWFMLMASVLRTLRVPLNECASWTVGAAQVLGVVCLAFTLLAVRRITKHGR